VKKEDVFGCIFCIFLFSTMAWFIGRESMQIKIQHEAVEKGVGEWVIEYQEPDFSDVKRSFRWKLPR